MADSGALRQRRHKQHRAGNHALCKPGCGGNPPVSRPSLTLLEPAGSIDPQAAMAELAEQLKAACAENPADAVLAREYRLTLQSLAPARKEPDDELTGLLNGLRR